MITRWLLVAAISFAVAATAWRVRAFTISGSVAAALVGTLVLGFGGWPLAVVMVAAVFTSSALTKWQASAKPHPEHRWGRSAAQVIANGALATALAVAYGMSPARWIITAFAATQAALTADTWATEVGLLSARPPRLITSRKRVEAGRSGGVTILGTTVGLAGALFIGVIATWILHTPFVSVWAGGTLAMLIDSVLGATVEGRYRGVNNDTVNFIMSAVGAGIAIVLAS